MNNKFTIFLLLSIAMLSCRKETTNITDESGTSAIFDTNLQNRGGSPTCIKADLQLINGVYQAGYEGFTVTVSNLSHMIYSNGNPLPLRDGDPAFGLISVPMNIGEDVVIQPEVPNSHFALSRLYWGVDNYIGQSYGQAISAAVVHWQQQMTIYNNLPPSVQAITSPPAMGTVNISDHIVSGSNGSGGVKMFTGKLIRSTTGNTTYAIACENYPVPPPLPPIAVGDEVALNKVVNFNGNTLNVFLHYNVINQSVTAVQIFDNSCNVIAVDSFTSGTFTNISAFTWSTTDTITIFLTGGVINITGVLSDTLIPC